MPARSDGFALHLLAIGDWGLTVDPTDSCCANYVKKGGKVGDATYNKHRYAQDNVAALLGQSAQLLKPKAVLGHGDSFYWSGLNENDAEQRFQSTFEDKYKDPALNVPWFNVMGNHDYGGSLGLHLPNDNRWVLKDYYYKQTIDSGDVSVDVSNVDTNLGRAHEMCCQCGGYSSVQDPACKKVGRGDAKCAGGDTGMFDACMDKLSSWTECSLQRMQADATASTATWKVVNSHYSPFYHLPAEQSTRWMNAMKEGGVQLFVSGHLHADGIDYAPNAKATFVTNGAGGGIQNQNMTQLPAGAGVKRVWQGQGEPYGFFELSFSATQARLQFISTGSGWKPEDQAKERTVDYCYNVPQDGSEAGGADGYDVHLLAIGDWGVTSDPEGSCCGRYIKTGGKVDDAGYVRHRYAQDNVAAMLGQSAQLLKPKAVLGHGDSFYWTGIGADDAQSRFQSTFEDKYKDPALNVPWFNVMGNHDYGGASYICEGGPCADTDALLQALEAKFTRQQQYKSPNDDRWQLKDHYYKETVQEGGVSVDIFNVDMNNAHSHGSIETCCQCYGYSSGDDAVCRNINRGDKMCLGGDTTMFDACVGKFKEWQDDSLKRMVEDAKASNATWKVVNSHYSPYQHLTPQESGVWLNALKEAGVQLFICGHTHAEGIDYSATARTTFVTNGAGGGIQSQSMGAPPDPNVKAVWQGKGEPYGFFELSFSAQQLRLQFISTGSGWKPEDLAKQRTVDYCYNVPHDGAEGAAC
ncbi:TPA: hypothetical protein N0F65_008119 [Lagenidium giganteum]|uniref:Calcineurin-like phosphoesterase domain-containing protein n=1 Tax=Lagenidium giganteum TaxID=4803 RepID=A0AAV2Z1J5_9STRA|nr:TPA: hypothetical protein N0F65_008119 [Lagenidium giganteum]